MKIAVVGACPYPVAQGSQVYLRSSARTLQELGHEVHVCVYGYGDGDAEDDLRVHRSPGIPFARRTKAGPSWAKPLQDARMVRFLRGVIRDHGIDVVVAHNYEALMVALATGFKRIVYCAHNAMVDELPYYRGFGIVGRTIGTMLDDVLPRRAHHVVAPHERLREYLITCGCAPERISVIPPGIDPAPFSGAARSTVATTVVYAGNLDAYQNPAMLADVFARVRELRPDARCVVATNDVRELPYADVVATPNLEALRAVLADDAVFICPRVSWSGYPIKLLNAMTAGLPVVACASAAHPVIDRETGFIVDDHDAEAFACRVVELLEDSALRRRLGEAGRRRSMDLYAQRDMIEAVLNQVMT